MGNLAGSQACPLGLLSWTQLSTSKMEKGLKREAKKRERDGRIAIRADSEEIREKEPRSEKNVRTSPASLLWYKALPAPHKHSKPVESFTPLWRVPLSPHSFYFCLAGTPLSCLVLGKFGCCVPMQPKSSMQPSQTHISSLCLFYANTSI